jgi:hypothetical protein
MQAEKSLQLQRQWLPLLIILMGGGMVAMAFAADLIGLGSGAGLGTNRVSLMLGGLLVFWAGLVALPLPQRGYILNTWVAVAALVVAMVADLFTTGRYVSPASRYFLFASLIFAFVLVRVTIAEGPKNNLLDVLRSAIKVDVEALAKFFSILVQLGLLMLVIREFQLENQAFYVSILQLTFYGFIFHYFLPDSQRLPFFLFLSLAAFVGVLGIGNGLWIIGIGVVLIVIGHLPVPFYARILGILAVGGGLMLARAGQIVTPIPSVIWPILGSIFMFRLIIYLYDLKHSKKPLNPWSSLSYFFLFPNVVFPFFPVIDHTTFVRTYYNRDQFQIYQSGIKWIFIGTIQLIAYRYVNYYLVRSPDEITTAYQFILYMLANFLLYLRVTGQFHIVVGLLQLFGFNLPRANERYLLSSSFTDLWRRANIYWKDFMQKIFYYPTFVWLNKKKVSPTTSLIMTMIIVFLATWFLHSYQWFWLRGAFLFAGYDILFWGLLAVLVLGSTLYEARKGRTRTLGQQVWTLRDVVKLGISNAATIFVLTFLWTLWSSTSIMEWLSLWSIILHPQGLIAVVVCFSMAVVVFSLLKWIYENPKWLILTNKNQHSFYQPALLYSGLTLALFLVAHPAVYNKIGGTSAQWIADLTTQRLSDRDAALLQRGYYEDLIGVNRFNSELWDVYSKRPTDWPLINQTEAAAFTDDFRLMILNPNVSIVFHGAQFSTNSWGMRDQEYSLVPSPGTYRIVLVGPSFVMGSGVADNEIFDALLETQLTQQSAETDYDKYEILNFGVAGHSALQELYVFEEDALKFQPNAVFYVAHQLEETILVRNLANRIYIGVEMPYEFLSALIERANIQPDMPMEAIEEQLKPFGQELVAWTYERVVALARERDMLPVWIFLPTFEGTMSEDIKNSLLLTAEEAGFIPIDLSKIYDDQEIRNITVAEWDLHPNRNGHALIARNLYEALLANPEIRAALGFTP